MKDLGDRLDKLIADASDCEIISNLTTNPQKRETFKQLAAQYRAMAETLSAEMKSARKAEVNGRIAV